MALPPFEAGAVHVTVTWVSPGVPAAEVGAPGTVYGMTADEAVDQEPDPTKFAAFTRNKYDVPFVSPVTVADVEVDTPSVNVVHVEPLSEEYCTP